MAGSKKKKKRPSTWAKNKAVAHLKRYRWAVEDVETRVPHSFVTKDLMGVFDLLALNPAIPCPTLAVQVTSESNHASRLTKVLNSAKARRCLECGWRVEVWGVRDRPGKDGKGIRFSTLILEEDGSIRVEERSLALESAST